MNGLAYIGRILDIQPIENADRIVQATVVCGQGGKWKAVVQKDAYQIGDLCEVYLQDALLPNEPRFSFLKSNRIKIMKLRGAYSECLVMPMSDNPISVEVGTDITEIVGVTKYEKPLPTGFWFKSNILGNFPAFIPKTDEPNFQKYPYLVDALRGKDYYVTQKMDGTSITIYNKDGYHVCSRNYEIANDKGAFDKFLTFPEGYAIQLEWCGPGIQGNPAGLKENQGFVFNVFSFYDDSPGYFGKKEFSYFTSTYGLPTVDTIVFGINFNLTDDQLRELAQGVYQNGKPQEGIVIRPMVEETLYTPEGLSRLSFKVINADYETK